MFIYKNLEDIIFQRHTIIPTDQLIILSGYIGPDPVMRTKELPFPVTIVYGMYAKDSIKEELHKSLLKIQSEQDNVKILYSTIPIHSKCYIWLNKNDINTALVGSANFSSSGLKNDYKESLAEITVDSFAELQAYYSYILENTMKCDEVNPTFQKNNIKIADDPKTSKISLLRNGKVPPKSGLNWGFSKGNVKPGDAYIPLHTKLIKSHPVLIPPKQGYAIKKVKGAKKTRQNDIIELIWDDGVVMEGLFEGTQTINGLKYPKQLSSSPSKNLIGNYLRKRMGLASNHKIEREDLEKYGRTDIEITLQGEGIYSLDFSVNN